jgi:hypothetical protein
MNGMLLLVALSATGDARLTAERRTDVVLQWNNVALDLIRAERTPPPQGARHLAMVHIAVYDSVNTVFLTHKPCKVALRATEDVDPRAAAAAAAHRVLEALYPKHRRRLDRALEESLEGVPAGAARRRGELLGRYVALKVLEWRRNDGSEARTAYRAESAVGRWSPTPPKYLPALLPHWSKVKPFAVRAADAFRPMAPPDLNSADYARDYNEVKRLGGMDSVARTAEQTLIAWFWDDGPGTCSPPGHWNLIAQEAARSQGNTLSENARLFALLNMALADAGIACWECKFHFNLWRPVTAIPEAARAGNPDIKSQRNWVPLLETPPFPSYASGHSTFSGAAARVLAHFFGTDEVRFTIGSDGLPGARRSFDRFSAAADEAGRSRIYGGIHYECDNREGLASGRAVADRIYRDKLGPRTAPPTAVPERPRPERPRPEGPEPPRAVPERPRPEGAERSTFSRDSR